jgi:Phosphoserine phosphatase RsbU, N-terminal domain
MTVPEDLARNYRVAFLRSLSRRPEDGLREGYEIGRAAVEQGVSILELAELHHQAFLAMLQDTPPDEIVAVATASSAFLLEVLATYDMAQRALPWPQPPEPPTP